MSEPWMAERGAAGGDSKDAFKRCDKSDTGCAIITR
jgi:hypothetical protein